VLGDGEPLGDRAVAHPLGDELQHVALARRERLDGGLVVRRAEPQQFLLPPERAHHSIGQVRIRLGCRQRGKRGQSGQIPGGRRSEAERAATA
jgi:hypothetical protein